MTAATTGPRRRATWRSTSGWSTTSCCCPHWSWSAAFATMWPPVRTPYRQANASLLYLSRYYYPRQETNTTTAPSRYRTVGHRCPGNVEYFTARFLNTNKDDQYFWIRIRIDLPTYWSFLDPDQIEISGWIRIRIDSIQILSRSGSNWDFRLDPDPHKTNADLNHWRVQYLPELIFSWSTVIYRFQRHTLSKYEKKLCNLNC